MGLSVAGGLWRWSWWVLVKINGKGAGGLSMGREIFDENSLKNSEQRVIIASFFFGSFFPLSFLQSLCI